MAKREVQFAEGADGRRTGLLFQISQSRHRGHASRDVVGAQRHRDGDRVGAVEFRLHTAGTILGALVIFPAGRAIEALRTWRDYARELPDGLTTLFAFNRHSPANLCSLNQHIKLHAFGSR